MLTYFPLSYFSIKRILLFLGILSISSSWGIDIREDQTLVTRSRKLNDNDVNIGYPKGKSSVPLTPECLFPQLGPIARSSVTIYARSVVEPTIAVNPKNRNHLVASWQQDRINNGGALEAAIAYSRNGGKTWHRTQIPLQICIGGINQRISDVWLSYAPDGKRVYLTVLVINASTELNTQNQAGIIVSVSEDDGKTWSIPHFVASSQLILGESSQLPFDDKNSITADRNHSKFAYCVWDRFPQSFSNHSDSQISRTTDGGKTWSPNQILYNPFPDLTIHGQSNGIENDNQTLNNIVVVLPDAGDDHSSRRYSDHNKNLQLNGDLLNFMVRIYAKPGATNEEFVGDSFPFQFTLFDIASVRSKDRGVTWEPNANVITPFIANLVFTGGYTYNEEGQITDGIGTQLRTGDQVPSYNVNPRNGFLYVAFQTGQFRSDQLPQIGLLRSEDGGLTWSQAVKVSRTPQNAPNPQAFSPFVAVTEEGYVGILYHDFRHDDKSNPNETKTDAWLAIYREVKGEGSTGIGLEFVKEKRLSRHSYIIQNGPNTTQGVMTNGDYPFLVAEGNLFYALYVKSRNGPFNPAVPILTNPTTGGVLLLDNNYRTAPFVSIVKAEK